MRRSRTGRNSDCWNGVLERHNVLLQSDAPYQEADSSDQIAAAPWLTAVIGREIHMRIRDVFWD